MKVIGLSAEQTRQAVWLASTASYEGNIQIKEAREDGRTRDGQPRAVFTIRATNSSGAGARRTSSDRRSVAACWHAHRDVMRVIMAANPNARIDTGMIHPDTGKPTRYEGREDFENMHVATGWVNTGSMMEPRRADNGCECES